MKPLTTRILLMAAAIVLIFGSAWNSPSSSPSSRLEDSPSSGLEDSPASLPAAGPTRIRFDLGATSGVVSGELAAHSSARYVLRAGARQLMDVTLSSPRGATMKVTPLSGWVLRPVVGTNGPTGFRGYLPYTGDYFITVRSGDMADSYSINVSIPVRVRFDTGTTSDVVEGQLNAHQGLDYILRAGEGQILEVNAASVEDSSSDSSSSSSSDSTAGGVPLQLVIYGVDGTVLRSGMGEGSTFRGELPSSQDYMVSVRAGDQPADFSMDVIIPQRIRFRTGAYSGSVFTRLAAERTQYYVLRAAQDQTMRVTITPDKNLQLAVYGVDGNVLKRATEDGASFLGDLPSDQDYILAVTAPDRSVSYTLKVTIR